MQVGSLSSVPVGTTSFNNLMAANTPNVAHPLLQGQPDNLVTLKLLRSKPNWWSSLLSKPKFGLYTSITISILLLVVLIVVLVYFLVVQKSGPSGAPRQKAVCAAKQDLP